MKMNRYYHFLFTALLVATSCSEGETESQQPDEQTVEEAAPDSVIVLKLANDIVQALSKKDYQALGDALGNEGKVRFSPFAMVDSTQNTLSKIELYSSTSKEMAWGNYDGSGKPIQLSIDDYFKQFVYNHNYASDSKVQIAYNRFIGRGNSLNNLKEFYANHHFVEYYYPGTEKYDQMDWSCLRLVFKKEGDSFLWVGIIHDQWTI